MSFLDLFLGKFEFVDWRTIEVPSSVATKLKQIEAGRASVWILMDNGKLLLRIGICTTNPFGEYWYEVSSVYFCPLRLFDFINY